MGVCESQNGQANKHLTVSLFSGCLGFELGWQKLGPQWDGPAALLAKIEWVHGHLLIILRMVHPACYVRISSL